MSKSHKLFLRITVNNVEIDRPSSLSIRKTKEIPIASMQYTSPYGKFYHKFLETDIFRIYVGIDKDCADPLFCGKIKSIDTSDSTKIELIGIESKTNECYTLINEYDNLDGMEVSAVIKKQLLDSGFANTFTFQGSDPHMFFDFNYRQARGVSRYEVIKKARDMPVSVDPATSQILRYVFFVYGDCQFFFLKQKTLTEANSWRTFTYGRDIVNINQGVDTLDSINRQVVLGKDNISNQYDLLHEQTLNGLKEGKPITNTELTDTGLCYEVARVECLKKRFMVKPSTLSSIFLSEIVPNYSIVKTVGIPDMADGFHRVEEVSIDIGNNFLVTVSLDQSEYLLSEALGPLISNLLKEETKNS